MQLGEIEREEFFGGLCDRLRKHSFDRYHYARHRDLVDDVIGLVEEYASEKPYHDAMAIWSDSDRWLIDRVSAFGREQYPDIEIKVGRDPLAAIEVKLLRDYYGLARGIGQAIINSAIYRHGIVFALDNRKFEAAKHEFDEQIQLCLRKNHGIELIIRCEESVS